MSTLLKDLFLKPIDRTIEGVIKADDRSALQSEIEEYVLTNEVGKRLENFLGAYNNYAGANGAWLSGFFGSGKSHLLKMLSLLLQNQRFEGKSVLEMFLPKCHDNAILAAELKKACGVPSESILFNIDQKADVISKKELDALLAVFVKVFDEHCGYYGKQGYIANFERDLDKRNLWQAFRDAYAGIAGKPWDRGREEAILEGANIAKAYAQVSGGELADAKGILDKYRTQYKLSIEEFAERVKAYVATKGANFRLNFFVDEVGQYVADNTKLMTNLQTVAESLATKCNGQSWILVTAQEDMDRVVGQMDKQQGNDFSKIQARFSSRLKLTSSNVDEVIQKRLLAKTEGAIIDLVKIYEQQKDNLKTMYRFGDEGVTLKPIKDADHFVQCYPFVPFQFDLFQRAIQSLSEHNAFEGRHSSVGERSMLGVFQQVVIEVGVKRQYTLGCMAPFDLMFEGLRTTLKSQIQSSVSFAEGSLGNTHPMAIRILKALFLVKYVKGFKSTVRNIGILLIDQIQGDLEALEKQVLAALALLERETYVQKMGDTYEFLTDEEKDVEREIKNTEIDSDLLVKRINDLVFERIIKNNKIQHEGSKVSYLYARKIDDQLQSREYDLCIHVATPNHPNADDPRTIATQSMGRKELLVILPADVRLWQDLKLYLQTEKYIRLNTTNTQRESVNRILGEKQMRLNERLLDVQNRFAAQVGKADLFVQGQAYAIASTDANGAQARLFKAFGALVDVAYTNLRMLRGIVFTESNVGTILQQSNDLFAGQEAETVEAAQEIAAYMKANEQMRMTVRTLCDRFERHTYGWNMPAVICLVAKLYRAGKVEARLNSNLLEGKALETALVNTAQHDNVILSLRDEVSPSQLRSLKDFYQELFDRTDALGDSRGLFGQIQKGMTELAAELCTYAQQVNHYPFLQTLAEFSRQVEACKAWNETQWVKQVASVSDALLGGKESLLNPVRKFWNGTGRQQFDSLKKFVAEHQANFSELDPALVQSFAEGLQSADLFKGPRLNQLIALQQQLYELLLTSQQTERGKAVARLHDLRTKLEGMESFAKLGPVAQRQLSEPFEALQRNLESETIVAKIRDQFRSFEEVRYPQLLAQCESMAIPPPPPTPPGEAPKPVPPPAPPKPMVALRSVQVSFAKALLDSEDDVDQYVGELKKQLLREIQSGKRIQV